jgi:chromate transporter
LDKRFQEKIMTESHTETASIPRQTLPGVFLRFLRFGLLAWGGPVAQIAMIKHELVDQERWITPARFNRVLAVYQVLPGPEAHELCVYFGMITRGRVGAVLAGLGFMLPGFILMFALSWFYATFGIDSPLFRALFFGFQPAAAALIVRAVHRIGGHALSNRWLWLVAILAGLLQWLEVHFMITLCVGGAVYYLIQGQFLEQGEDTHLSVVVPVAFMTASTIVAATPLLTLFGFGLRSGLLTFGGAYTVIPFLQHDAVVVGGWMTNQQFLDGLALSSILPAPLIIFATFVGYLGGGPLGALVLTVGIFLPAFAFTLIGHSFFEKLVEQKTIHAFLDGITASVVGLIAATTIGFLQTTLIDIRTVMIFLAALIVLFRWRSKFAVAVIMLGAGAAGLLISSLG